MPKPVKVVIGLAALILLVALSQQSHDSPSGRYSTAMVELGDSAWLRPETTDPVILAVTEAVEEQMITALNAKDAEGLKELALTGQVFLADPNTAVKVIGLGGEVLRVRLLDGKHKDRAGWVPTEWVMK